MTGSPLKAIANKGHVAYISYADGENCPKNGLHSTTIAYSNKYPT